MQKRVLGYDASLGKNYDVHDMRGYMGGGSNGNRHMPISLGINGDEKNPSDEFGG